MAYLHENWGIFDSNFLNNLSNIGMEYIKESKTEYIIYKIENRDKIKIKTNNEIEETLGYFTHNFNFSDLSLNRCSCSILCNYKNKIIWVTGEIGPLEKYNQMKNFYEKKVKLFNKYLENQCFFEIKILYNKEFKYKKLLENDKKFIKEYQSDYINDFWNYYKSLEELKK